MANDSCAVTKRAYFFLWLFFRIGHASQQQKDCAIPQYKNNCFDLSFRDLVHFPHAVPIFFFAVAHPAGSVIEKPGTVAGWYDR
jgi:hypothetical protein